MRVRKPRNIWEYGPDSLRSPVIILRPFNSFLFLSPRPHKIHILLVSLPFTFSLCSFHRLRAFFLPLTVLLSDVIAINDFFFIIFCLQWYRISHPLVFSIDFIPFKVILKSPFTFLLSCSFSSVSDLFFLSICPHNLSIIAVLHHSIISYCLAFLS